MDKIEFTTEIVHYDLGEFKIKFFKDRIELLRINEAGITIEKAAFGFKNVFEPTIEVQGKTLQNFNRIYIYREAKWGSKRILEFYEPDSIVEFCNDCKKLFFYE